MKKRKSLFTIIMILFVCFIDLLSPLNIQAATKITKREKEILKSYIKSLETFDTTYLEKYTYPGITIETGDDYNLDDEDLEGKVICPRYTKVYDKNLKAYVIYVDAVYVLVSKESEVFMITTLKSGVVLKKKGSKYFYYSEKVEKSPEEITSITDLTKTQRKKTIAYLYSIFDEDYVDIYISLRY